MTASAEISHLERRARIVPPAENQAPPAEAPPLNSGTAGVVVSKVGQLRSQYRDQGRMFAREMAKHVNSRQAGQATAYVYEETFGYEDRIHFLIHLHSLDTYYAMVEMGDQDRAYRASVASERVDTADGAGAWDRLFLDGSMTSTVLLPRSSTAGSGAAETLHSGSAGIVVHRSAQIGYGFRAEALELADELVAALSSTFAGQASAVLYEEAFGAAGRLHWLIHLRDLTSYRLLVAADVLAMQGRPGTFVEGSVVDVALTPHHWGLYATRAGDSPAG
ncbi:MAG: hypothetical protein HY241_12360 [Actinobacteria bacterium]|nr:hypothetical protein [Actinomycetota bacterium]